VTLVFRSESRLTVRGQGSLVLSDVTSRDTGVYTCRAINAQDAVDASAHVRVIGTSFSAERRQVSDTCIYYPRMQRANALGHISLCLFV